MDELINRKKLMDQHKDDPIDAASIRLLVSVSKELSHIQAKKDRREKSRKNERNIEYLFSISRALSEIKAAEDEKQEEICVSEKKITMRRYVKRRTEYYNISDEPLQRFDMLTHGSR